MLIDSRRGAAASAEGLPEALAQRSEAGDHVAADPAFLPTAGARRLTVLARRPGLWFLVLLGLGLLIAAALRARGPVVGTTLVERTNLEQHLVASGRVRVVTRVDVAAQVAGRVTAVPAVEGRRVRAGDLLVQLDDEEARAEVAQARAAVAQATARVEQLRKVSAVVATEATRQADTALERAETELARMQTLLRAGAVAQTDVDEARRSVEIAGAQRAAAGAQETSAMPQGAESRLAMSVLAESQARLTAARTRLDQTRIRARQDGTVLTKFVEPGDSALVGDTLLEIAGDGETQLVIEPDERNLAWIRSGQIARAAADAFPDEVFDATVCYIAPAIDPRRGSVEVRLCVPNPPPGLLPDMTVSVDLTVAARTQVLAVPTDAIHDAATAAPWVLAVENGRAVRRDVQLWIAGEGHTKIRSGVDGGDEVIVSDGRALAPGARVRARRSEG